MPEENSIADAAPSRRAGTSAGTLSGMQKVGLFAGRFRWVICGLLFLGVTKNYMDRQVLGVLKGPLQHDLGWNDIDYGHLVFAFQTAYAAGMILMGRLITAWARGLVTPWPWFSGASRRWGMRSRVRSPAL